MSGTAVLLTAVMVSAFPALPNAMQAALSPAPQVVTMAQLKSIGTFDGHLIQMNALVRHTDTAQVFTLGEKQGPEVHVVIPRPATDAAHVGDTVTIVGFVRRYNSGTFEKDYTWFRRSDYPEVHGGDWVIVATSVRTPEGTELVPPGVISNTPPDSLKSSSPKSR